MHNSYIIIKLSHWFLGDKCGGITPLHDACASGHAEMIELLIDSGANVIAKEDEVGVSGVVLSLFLWLILHVYYMT